MHDMCRARALCTIGTLFPRLDAVKPLLVVAAAAVVIAAVVAAAAAAAAQEQDQEQEHVGTYRMKLFLSDIWIA